MRKIRIDKGNGKTRLIYAPSHAEKRALRSVLGDLNRKAVSTAAHGFVRNRSPVTCAQQHVGHKFTVTMDLADFFDSINESHLKGKLSNEIIAKVLVDGAPRQGLPTSPAVANLAALELDKAIQKLNEKYQFIYTRYADDLAFSCDEESVVDCILKTVPQIVRRCGFTLNESKTKVHNSQRRIIVGVAVDEGLHIPRKIKRKMRAAKHQGNTSSLAGLEEWAKLKLPRRLRENFTARVDEADELLTLARHWKLGNLSIRKIPERPADEIIGQTTITGDPVMILGMSSFTTGWRSCMTHPDGKYRIGTKFWLHLRGTSIAYRANSTKIIAGVERPAMVARALLHTLRNGVRVYDRIYGNEKDELEADLKSAGVISMAEAQLKYKSVKVVGHAPSSWRAYFDNLRYATSVASEGIWKGKEVRVCMI